MKMSSNEPTCFYINYMLDRPYLNKQALLSQRARAMLHVCQ